MARALRALGSPARDLPAVVRFTRVSSLFRTRPVSPIDQADFFNAAFVGTTELAADEMLAVLKACEWLLGRRRSRRWGPRPLDLDLLSYSDLTTARPELELPHPRLRERRFYLEPLAEIAPVLRIPPGNDTVLELLSRLPEGGVRRVSGPLLQTDEAI